jgi:hypothetical protein
MYVLKDCNYDFMSKIENGKISFTSKLNEAIILEEEQEAESLLNFCNLFQNGYYKNEQTIYEIDFKEVEEE